MEFVHLPLELLTQILSHFVKAQHLAHACRVNKAFYEFGIPRLYERASIYSWHKHAKMKVIFREIDVPNINIHGRSYAYSTPSHTTPAWRNMSLDWVRLAPSNAQ
jgi:hypothetical protein